MKESDLIYGIMASLGKEEYSIVYMKYLLEPFNVSDSSLRTTLSRMMEKGLLKSRKTGRLVFYSFEEKGLRIRGNVSYSFHTSDWSKWDNTWWGYVFTIPSGDKNLRYKVRTKLEKYRFVSLYPGYWIRPFHESEKIDEKFNDLMNSGYGHLIKVEFISELTKEGISELWKIESVNEDFETGLKHLNESILKLPNVDPQEAFRLKMLIGNEIVHLLFRDPLLPKCFLPNNWKGEELRKLFSDWEKAVNIKAELFWNI
ncbi:MAG: hypothetical protein JEZ04_11855 [Spirochaetales bacterium]|nr:hypothetical protein [Spirochaetales bacterium]